MPEPTATSISPQPGEVLDYKPVSGWAILGLLLGIVFSLAVVFGFLYGLITNNPLWLPPWTLFVAVAGVAVSLLALWQIAVSEGTRVGKPVAIWGLWLSIVSALGYTAFYFFTRFALVSQANDFVMNKDAENMSGRPISGFFPRLQEGAHDPTQFNIAFLLAIPPEKRKDSDPSNEESMRKTQDVNGLLTRFREVKLVKLVHDSGGKVTFEPRGVVNWGREQGGFFKVERNYLINTPELTAVITLAVYSFDSPGEPRRWIANVIPGQSDPVKILRSQYTPLGKAIRELQEGAYKSLRDWTKNLPPGPLPIPNNTASDKVVSKDVQAKVSEVFGQEAGATRLDFAHPAFVPARWEQVEDKLRFHYPVSLKIPPEQPLYILEGFMTVESRTPVDPHNLGKDEVAWKVVSLEWERMGIAMNRAP